MVSPSGSVPGCLLEGLRVVLALCERFCRRFGGVSLLVLLCLHLCLLNWSRPVPCGVYCLKSCCFLLCCLASCLCRICCLNLLCFPHCCLSFCLLTVCCLMCWLRCCCLQFCYDMPCDLLFCRFVFSLRQCFVESHSSAACPGFSSSSRAAANVTAYGYRL